MLSILSKSKVQKTECIFLLLKKLKFENTKKRYKIYLS